MPAEFFGSRLANRPRYGLATALILFVALLVPQAASAPADPEPQETVWLCRPDLPADPCRGDLTTTVRTPGEPDVVVPAPAAERHEVDCFYVYPTVSTELSYSASLDITPPIRAIAEQQAQRFSEVCDVYAPVYRQRTLLALRSPGTPGQAKAAAAMAFRDVARAWEQYLNEFNHGRGVVLIGHSQGTRMLRQLLRERIEPDPAANARLVSAVLVGGNVVVPRGADAGGDFHTVPLCRRTGQTHCVIAWSAFGQAPPPDARYGVTPTTAEADPQPFGPGYEIACVNPAFPQGDAEVPLHTLTRSALFPGIFGLGDAGRGGLPPAADTPWLRPAERYLGRCARIGDAHVLLVRPEPDAPALSAFPDPGWGLHAADITLPLGDVVAMVGTQIETYRQRSAQQTVWGR
ncbi:MAG TPA: DUF3089 domain-containing protein [Nocardia sp.]|uniref:DUF3089 domain-containing protein n=1 Tax=Nocardia sp. TaxID=1821 RepID=UPI002B4B83EF|nr:DUF3089 domain-containing protein [Nocardia sp.]HLS75867.1 DUF3089 domain-containing protein [Nocardia sp.]